MHVQKVSHWKGPQCVSQLPDCPASVCPALGDSISFAGLKVKLFPPALA